MMLTLFSDKLEGIPKQILCIISEIVIMVLVYVLMVKGGMSVFNIGKGQVFSHTGCPDEQCVYDSPGERRVHSYL